MGINGSRVIKIDDLEEQMARCQILRRTNNPIYGEVHLASYKDMEFYIGQSETLEVPHPLALHYFAPPNLLIISDYKLLEDICPSSLNGIADMALSGGPIGIGKNRVACAGRWGVVGEYPIDWPYQQVLEGTQYSGAYLSPQLMISLSQNKRIAKHNVEKSDVYALGIMLVEIISQQNMEEIFDYDNFEIRLNSLLEVLLQIRQQYGDQVYHLFIGMLETEEADRFSFEELYNASEEIRRVRQKLGNSRMNSSTHSRDMTRGNHTPTRGRTDINAGNKTPKGGRENPYRNGVSPFRGRFAPNAHMPERVGRGVDVDRMKPQPQPQQQQHTSRSPLRRDLKINTQFGRESQHTNGYGNQMARRVLSPISRR